MRRPQLTAQGGLDRLTWQASWRGWQPPKESRWHFWICFPRPGSLQTQGSAGDGVLDAHRVRGSLRAGVHRVPCPAVALGLGTAHLGLPCDAGLCAGVRLMDERGLRVGAGNPGVPGGRMVPAGHALSGPQAPGDGACIWCVGHGSFPLPWPWVCDLGWPQAALVLLVLWDVWRWRFWVALTSPAQTGRKA